MKITHPTIKIGLASVFLAALTGCTTYVVQQPQQAYTTPPPPPAPVVVEAPAPPPPPVVVQAPPSAPDVVVIQNDGDFYQPLSPYGDWVAVSGYGQVWRPRNVDSGWRPYANGHWELTDDGWYWESDEPWGWATYHYGRWELSGGYGWIWVPQTQWAPAWVEWRQGGGYVGWAPLPPERVGVSVTIAPASFCFVDERRIHDPVRPTTVIVNNTTVINKTVIINKTKVVNKVVVHDGPDQNDVERVTGKKIDKVSVNELRHKDEVTVAQHERDAPVKNTQPQRGIQKQPPEVRNNPPQNFQNSQHPQPGHVEQVSAPEKNPVRQGPTPTPAPTQVHPQPLPVTPPRNQQGPDKNNHAVPFGGENPKPTPIKHQPMPVEKPGHAPGMQQNKSQQQLKTQFSVKGQQKNNPTPKNNEKGHDGKGNDSSDNGNQREKR